MLNACHPEFLRQLWDRLLQIAETQINRYSVRSDQIQVYQPLKVYVQNIMSKRTRSTHQGHDSTIALLAIGSYS